MMNALTWQLYNGSTNNYDRFRPNYPRGVFDAMMRFHQGHALPTLAADIGCGTGIFSRQLAVAVSSLTQIECLEANTEMVATAQKRAANLPQINVKKGVAEDLPFDDDSFDLVTAATAANWFDRPIFYSEAARLLRDRGTLLIVQNKHRYWDSDFLSDFAAFQEEHIPGYRRGRYSDFKGGYGEADFFTELQEHPKFLPVERQRINWSQTVTADQFAGYCYSMGHIKKAIDQSGVDRISSDIQKLIERHAGTDNVLTINWATDVVMAGCTEPRT